MTGSFGEKQNFGEKSTEELSFHGTEEWCKTWRKIDLLFQKCHEIGKFSSEHSKVSKISTLIGPVCPKHIMFDLKKYRRVILHDTVECCFWPKYVIFELKNTEELFFITLEGDANFEGKLNCGLENNMRNFGNFHQSLKVSKKEFLRSTFIESRKCMSLKFKGSYVLWKWRMMQNLKRNWLVRSILRGGI